MNEPSQLTEQEQIALIAYRIYEQEGRHDGHSAEHWARAQRIVHEQRMGVHDATSQGPGPEALEPPKQVVP
jgi:Protein of unknown function (DUF2934)